MKKIPIVSLQKENSIVKTKLMQQISRLVDDSNFVEGKVLEEFERKFSRYCGVRYCLGVGSGTDALRTALLACGIGPGDEVITTPISYTSTSLAIAHTCARPVFVDVVLNGNIDPEKIPAAITPKTKAILIVHMYGNPCNMDAIRKIAKKYNLFLIDDCSHAQGAIYNGCKVGSLADISCFSFYPTKNLGAWGDAGGITTNNKKLAHQAYLYKNYGEEANERNSSKVIGYNSKLDPIQALVLSEKLKHLEHWNNRRRQLARRYTQALSKIPELGVLPLAAGCSYYVYPIKITERKSFMKFMEQNGISAKPYYPRALHLQKCFAGLGYKSGDFPVAEKHAATVCALPLWPSFKKTDQDKVIAAVKQFFRK